MVDFPTAREKMCEHFETYWQANAAGVLTYVPEILYPRTVQREPMNKSRHWGRLSISEVGANQAGFCSDELGRKRYESYGLVFVQLFAPANEIDAGEKQDILAKIGRSAFRGVSIPGRIWFRRARINDLPDENAMLRLNVVAEYEYTETE